MTIEGAYWVALAVGGAFLLLSIVFGDVFGFLDFLDFDIGDGFSATPVFFTALAAFGGGGLLAIQAFNATTGASVFAGLGSAVVFGGLAAGLFKVLQRQEATEGFRKSGLIGSRGRCVLAIQPGREGRVAVAHAGMTRTLSATSTESIATGEEVVVVDAVSETLRVAKATTSAASEGG